MARIRTVKPEMWTDERLTECSLSARLLFIGLLNFADDNGNLRHSPKRIKMQVFPADNIETAPLLAELITHGLLMEYSVNGENFLHIKGFTKHQVINRPSKTDIPKPQLNEDSLSTHGVLSDGKEGKGKEGINTPLPPLQGEIDGDDENEETDDQPAKPKRDSSVTLSTYLQNCSQQGCKAVPDDHFIRGWAETAGIDAEMMQVAWFAFRDDHIHGGRKAKKYKDWPAAFANSVKAGWYRLWFIPANGAAEWTSQGRAAQRNYGEVAA